MSYKKNLLIGYIADNLAFSSKSTSLENVIGLFDSNRTAQEFFANLFSLIFGYNNLKELDKLNGIVNYPAIDLGDTDKRIAFQITINNDSEKIKDTIKKFIEHELYRKYDRLVIYIIGKKKDYSTTFDSKNKFIFSKTDDIWDDDTIINAINELEIPKLEEIKQFLEEHLIEFKFPERLFSSDIKSCIELLKRDMKSYLVNEQEVITYRLSNRTDDFIAEKNRINNISWDFFKDKIQGHLQYNETITSFLQNPINKSLLDDYFLLTHGIQNFYKQNRDSFISFEDVFRQIFSLLNNYEDKVSNLKVKIVLHNMYFNCDIGDNPAIDD